MEANFESEFLSFRDNLRSYLYRLTANTSDADDILQDTYLRVSEKKEQFRHSSSFKTWVFAIATNLAKDNKRAQNRWAADAQDACKDAAMKHQEVRDRMEAAFQSQTEKVFELNEHINYCFTCLAKNLTLEKQIALILKEIYDFKRTEIAEILNVTEGVVKHLLFDGRSEMMDKYDHRCALIKKEGMCYQCGELNDYYEPQKRNAAQKVAALGFGKPVQREENFEIRMALIKNLNPLNSNGSRIEDTILQILRETIGDD